MSALTRLDFAQSNLVLEAPCTRPSAAEKCATGRMSYGFGPTQELGAIIAADPELTARVVLLRHVTGLLVTAYRDDREVLTLACSLLM
jgi:hypothetical protein